jgi:ABC-type molybdate transport system substrate-binding protein
MIVLRRRVERWRAVMAFGAIAASVVATDAIADTVEIYAAGSLRTAVEALVKQAVLGADVELKPTFGGSGILRQRIEAGEHPDLFLSADMGNPRKLAEAGRAIVPVVAFARNRMCLVARQSVGLTQTNLVDRMLAADLRLKTSTPVLDPAGDYAMAIFDRIDASRPGAGRILREKAQSLMDASKAMPPVAGHSAGASLFLNNQIDLMVTYCSATQAVEKEVPGLATVIVPPELEPRPVYGMAVLSAKPGAMRFALFLLSEDGQAIVARAGLLPIQDVAH